jgi:hypothetical protein
MSNDRYPKIFDGLTWLLMFGFGVFSFLFSWFGFINGSFLLRGLTSLVCLIIVLCVVVTKDRLPVNKLNISLFFFLLFYCLRLYLNAISGEYNFDMTTDVLMLKTIAMVWIPFLTVSILGISQIPLKASQITLFVICTLALVDGIVNGYSDRLAGNDILNPITLGAFAGMLMVIIAYRVRILNSSMLQPFNFVPFFVATVVLSLSLSRGAMLATVVVMYMIFFSKSAVKSTYRNLAILLMLAIGVFVVFNSDLGIATSRIAIDLGDENSDGEARVILWILAIQKIIAYPIFGSSVTTSMGYVHNIYLESIMAVGLVASLLFFYPILSIQLSINKLNKINSPISLSVYLFIFHATACIFSGTVYNSEYLWLTFAMALNSVKDRNTRYFTSAGV